MQFMIIGASLSEPHSNHDNGPVHGIMVVFLCTGLNVLIENDLVCQYHNTLHLSHLGLQDVYALKSSSSVHSSVLMCSHAWLSRQLQLISKRQELLIVCHEDCQQRQAGTCKCSITLYKQTEPTETVELYTGLPTCHHAHLCEKACGLTVLQSCDIHNDIGTTLYSLQYLMLVVVCWMKICWAIQCRNNVTGWHCMLAHIMQKQSNWAIVTIISLGLHPSYFNMDRKWWWGSWPTQCKIPIYTMHSGYCLTSTIHEHTTYMYLYWAAILIQSES